MPGVFEFYIGRLRACHLYGFKAGEEMLSLIHSCAYYDANNGWLTLAEFTIIINECQRTHEKLLEEDYNNGWYEQNPEG